MVVPVDQHQIQMVIREEDLSFQLYHQQEEVEEEELLPHRVMVNREVLVVVLDMLELLLMILVELMVLDQVFLVKGIEVVKVILVEKEVPEVVAQVVLEELLYLPELVLVEMVFQFQHFHLLLFPLLFQHHKEVRLHLL
jgi:hypothetical protein